MYKMAPRYPRKGWHGNVSDIVQENAADEGDF